MNTNNMQSVIISSLIMLLIDIFYINFNKKYFNEFFYKVQQSKLVLNPLSALIAYILMIIGINHFIISKQQPVSDAFLLGLVIYGVYDATNYATLKNWTINMALTDTLWGATLFSLTTCLTYYIKRTIKK